MNEILTKDYKIIFENAPDANFQDWQLAEKIMSNWDVPKLGENLAKEVIFQTVNHINYPNKEKTMEIVGRAESFATELFIELSDIDPHMDVIAYLERIYDERKKSEFSEPYNDIKMS